MKLVVLITHETERGLDIALAWREAGAPGVTILRAFGLHSLSKEIEDGTVELPRMVVSMAAAMAAVIGNAEERGYLIMSLVDDDLVDKLIAESNRTLGDLTEPGNGILFVVPIERAIGVVDHGRRGS